MASFNASDVSLKYLSQRALGCYIRSIALEGDKQVFDASQLPIEEMTRAYGLVTLPPLKIPKTSKTKETNRNTFGYRRESTQEALELQQQQQQFEQKPKLSPLKEEEEEEEDWLHPVVHETNDVIELDPSWKAQEVELEQRRVKRRENKGKPKERPGSPSLLADLGENEAKQLPPSTMEEYAQRVRDKLQSQLEHSKQMERQRVKEMHKKRKWAKDEWE